MLFPVFGFQIKTNNNTVVTVVHIKLIVHEIPVPELKY